MDTLCIKSILGGSENADKFAGFVYSTTSHFPTTRFGEPLKNEDYVRASGPLSTFPFTIDGVEFERPSQLAFYNADLERWDADVGKVQDTSEVPIKNKSQEGITGLENYQNQLNINFKKRINGYVHSQVVATDIWQIEHNYNVTDNPASIMVYDTTGKNIGGAVWTKINNNSGTLSFGKPISGIARIKF